MRFMIPLILLLSVALVMGCESEEGDIEARASPTITATLETIPSPEPIATLEATPIATPTLPAFTTAECEYLEDLQQQVGQLGEAMKGMSAALAQPNPFSEDWIWGIASHLASIRVISDNASSLNPPSSLSELHNQWLLAIRLYDEMTDKFAAGIDQIDSTKIQEAAGLALRANDELDRTKSLLFAFFDIRSGECP